MKVMMKLKGSGTCKFFDDIYKVERLITHSGWLLRFNNNKTGNNGEEEFEDADYVLEEVSE